MIGMTPQNYHKFGAIILYGVAMAAMIFVLKWLQWKFLIEDHYLEIYIGLIAIFFSALGIWVATHLTGPKIQMLVIEKEVYAEPNERRVLNEIELKKLKLSSREYEVLQLLTQGHTNAEIAEKLYLSLSTIKTHVSNLFTKMEVKNRTQAIEKANRLNITSY
jgi:two-component system, NarL family, response regulator LiaR